MSAVVDGRGVAVVLQAPPQRIVSLVPSTTETLFDLGAGDRVVGVTRFCVHPADQVRAIAKVGGTKDADPARVVALRPDLIVGNCEENTREIFDALADVAPLYAAFPRTVDDALADLANLGALLGAEDLANDWIDRIADRRRALGESVARRPRQRAAYLIWRDPWMSVSRDTFVDRLLGECGLDNVFGDRDDRYPVVTAAEIRAADPDLVLLSSEPFPFAERHATELATACSLPYDRFRFVSGEDFTWHGTHLAGALDRLGSSLAR